MKINAFTIILLVLVTMCPAVADYNDVKILTEHVSEIASPGIPGPLCVFGKDSFSVVTGGSDAKLMEPVVAAAKMGKGHVVAFGHDGYFGYEALQTADTGLFLLNTIWWAAGNKANARIAVHSGPDIIKYLAEHEITAEALDGTDWYTRLNNFDILLSTPWGFDNDTIKAVSRFINNGGGFVTAALGWGYLQLNPEKTIDDLPGNILLAKAGIVWADGMLNKTSTNGYKVSSPPADCHALNALETITGYDRSKRNPENIAQAVKTITRAAMSVPQKDRIFMPKLHSLRKKMGKSSIVPTEKAPITSKQPVEKLLLTLDLLSMKETKNRLHPAAADFPGAVPKNAVRINKDIEIDTSVSAWHSVGLYAAPGETITLECPNIAGNGLSVRIGCHSDTLWDLDSWKRVPDICRTTPMNKSITKIANPFGGIIYIVVPENCKLGKVSIKIKNAIQSPLYILGKTSLTDWKNTIRSYPGPWAELATDKVILTIPSETIRKLDDPENLMKFWDQVLDACADLAVWPRERSRPERYVADRQISAGYMHSGYPIMTWMDVINHEVDLDRLMHNTKGMDWGFFHEMGHNHQSADWTFEGTGEVTENLFSLYVLESVCGIKSSDTREQMTPEGMAKAYKQYVESGRSFEKWKSDPFLALSMYVQIKDAFGWDTYKKVFAEYRALPDYERPKTDDEKRDQWLVRLSRTAGKNLGPFFEAWGVPTSKQARDSISSLPVWMPKELN